MITDLTTNPFFQRIFNPPTLSKISLSLADVRTKSPCYNFPGGNLRKKMKDIANDHLVLIQIEGMHCHRCEQTIQRTLSKLPGVREVEVDFLSGQASVLAERNSLTPKEMVQAINDAGYHATGFVERAIDHDAAC